MLQLSGSHHNLDTDLLIYVIVAYFNGQMFDQGNWIPNNDASAYDRIHYILKASKVVWNIFGRFIVVPFRNLKYFYSIYLDFRIDNIIIITSCDSTVLI